MSRALALSSIALVAFFVTAALTAGEAVLGTYRGDDEYVRARRAELVALEDLLALPADAPGEVHARTRAALERARALRRELATRSGTTAGDSAAAGSRSPGAAVLGSGVEGANEGPAAPPWLSFAFIAIVLLAAVAFAGRDVLRDGLQGVVLRRERSIRVGDVVRVGACEGFVVGLTLRHIVLRDLAGVIRAVPNRFARELSNFSDVWSRERVDVRIGYDDDLDAALDALREAVLALRDDPFLGPLVRRDELPVAEVERFADGGAVLRVTFAARPVGGSRLVDAAREAIARRFDALGSVARFEDDRGTAGAAST